MLIPDSYHEKIDIYLPVVFLLLEGCSSTRKMTVYTIEDSTMANKKAEVYPETGWSQQFHNYFDSKVTVRIHAMNGRSSKSFIDDKLS